MSNETGIEKEHCNGHDLRRMLAASALMLEGNVEVLNALNVFPVPDGDTGTNMLLTMKAVTEEANRSPSTSAGEMAAAVAKGALLGARGNSGVILSQFFRGLSEGLKGKEQFNGLELAQALQEATKWAYKAVSEPVEGTMLTVIREATQAATERGATGGNLLEVCLAARDACKATVARTPTLLAVLREAGVVDAGGQGLCFIVEGFLSYLQGEDTADLKLEVEQPVGVEAGTGIVDQDFLTATEEEIYGYCTQFLIQGENLDPDAIRGKMASMAGSTVVIGDETMVKVHVHADDPGVLLSLALPYGSLAQIKIDNMDEQHQQYLAARRQEVKELPIAVVSVASGPGLENLFSGNGAAAIVPGGDTMNPSTQEILQAAEAVPSRSVIILPNNRNILAAAQQACELSKKSLRVVPTQSIPQGVSAILAFNPEVDLDENLHRMEKARTAVRTGEITTAVRAAKMGGVSVQKGQIIGLLERELVAAGDDPQKVLMELLRKASVSQGDLVTLYWGSSLVQHSGEQAAAEVAATFSGVEVEAVNGGQPYYHYLVSIE